MYIVKSAASLFICNFILIIHIISVQKEMRLTKNQLSASEPKQNRPSFQFCAQSQINQSQIVDEHCSSSNILDIGNIQQELTPSQELEQIRKKQIQNLHQSRCFQCHRPEDLIYCSTCHRSFHQSCKNNITNQNIEYYQCDYCLMRLKKCCSYCQTAIDVGSQNNSKNIMINTEELPPKLASSNPNLLPQRFICTLCYCYVHPHCSQRLAILSKSQNYFFKGNQNFVCFGCIKAYNSISIITTKRIQNGHQQKLYFFVSLIGNSPIHCTWIQEKDLALKKTTYKLRQESTGRTHQFKNRIQKIISYRFPCNLSPQKGLQQLNDFINNPDSYSKCEYGEMNNLKFLVKWKNCQGYAWQDQTVISRYTFALKKFTASLLFQADLHKNQNMSYKNHLYSLITNEQIEQFQSSLGTKKKLPPLMHIQFDPDKISTALIRNTESNIPKIKQQFDKLLNQHRTIDIIDTIRPFYDIIEVLTKCINEIYFKQQPQECMIDNSQISQTTSTTIVPNLCVIITQQSNISKWKDQLDRNCPLLQYTCLDNRTNVLQVFKKDFLYEYVSYPRFQILILTYEIYMSHWQHISDRILINIKTRKIQSNIQLTIYDSFKIDFLDLKQVGVAYSNKIVFLDALRDMWLTSQIISHLPQYKVYTFAADFPERRDSAYQKLTTANQTLQNNVIITGQNSYFKQSKWNQIQRLSFHLYVLAYGMGRIIRNTYCILDQLQNYEPQLFQMGQGQEKNIRIQQCNKYVNKYINLIRDYKYEQIPDSQEASSFLFGLKRQCIYKRISQLSIMQSKVQEYKSKPQVFPFKLPLTLYIRKSQKSITAWKGVHDYILCCLILQHGFGNWTQILEDDIKQYIILLQNSQTQSWQNFGQFMMKILAIRSRSPSERFQVRKIVQERSKYCLKLMSTN